MKTLLVLFLSLFPFVSQSEVIYGVDNRVNSYEHYDSRYRTLARSVAARISNYSLRESKLYSSYLDFSKGSLRDQVLLCEDERFGRQPGVADCTGFLVGPKTLVTAGHCMKSESVCSDNSWVFDYVAKSDFDSQVLVPKSSVYGCKSVKKQVYYGSNDYAVIELDRVVRGRSPLKLRSRLSGSIYKNERVFMIGHPSGLPQKISDGAWVIDNYGAKGKFFRTNLDSFGGNSGSPVFNAVTLEVEGILVRGERDYDFDSQNYCFRPKQCNLNGKFCRGEDVTRIKEVYE